MFVGEIGYMQESSVVAGGRGLKVWGASCGPGYLQVMQGGCDLVW